MAPGAAGTLQVSAYRLSKLAQYQEKGARDDAEFWLSWDSERLSLASNEEEPVHVAIMLWSHVTGVWVALRSDSRKGFQLEITLETSHTGCEMDFVHVQAAMNGVGGEFLQYLQTSQAGRLKEGRAPKFATSRWGSCILGQLGFSVRSLRLLFGRLSIIFEVLFSLCFFAQLQNVLLSKEAKLWGAFSALWDDVGAFRDELYESLMLTFMEMQVYNLAWSVFIAGPQIFFYSLWKVALHTSNWVMLLMLLQHLFTVVFMLDGMFRVLRGALKSALTFHKAAKRVNKAVKKASTKELEVQVPADIGGGGATNSRMASTPTRSGADTDPDPADTPKSAASEGVGTTPKHVAEGVLRQRAKE